MGGENSVAAVLNRVEATNGVVICDSQVPMFIKYLPFDQYEFIWCHSREVLPLVIRIEFHAKCLAFVVGINACHWEKITRFNTTIITQCQRPVDGCMVNGSP